MLTFVPHAFVVKPLDPLSIFPDSLSCGSLRYYENALSVLLAVSPLAFVGPTVGIGVNSVAMFLVIHVLALVLSTISPGVNTLSVHFIFQPVSLVRPAIVPIILAIP